MNENSKRTGGAVMVEAAGSNGRVGVVGVGGARDALTEVLRQGAVDLLAAAVRAEAAAWINDHAHVADADGRRQVVRNGFLPEREIVTGIDTILVKQPRVHDRRLVEQREKFTGAILPPYLRKMRSIVGGSITVSGRHQSWDWAR
ncbi:MAG: hypothetical protein IT438_10700 [Phycisphaerales bacterium]|nr:hypothetical protein [Phycisphaerales bacterium]